MNFKVHRHVLSQYPALWLCLIYEAAAFILSPVVYQPHETSSCSSYTGKCLTPCYTHSSDHWLLLQYTNVWWTTRPTSAEQRQRAYEWSRCTESHTSAKLLHIPRSFSSSVLLGLWKEGKSQMNFVDLIVISVGAEGNCRGSYCCSSSVSQQRTVVCKVQYGFSH